MVNFKLGHQMFFYCTIIFKLGHYLIVNFEMGASNLPLCRQIYGQYQFVQYTLYCRIYMWTQERTFYKQNPLIFH